MQKKQKCKKGRTAEKKKIHAQFQNLCKNRAHNFFCIFNLKTHAKKKDKMQKILHIRYGKIRSKIIF